MSIQPVSSTGSNQYVSALSTDVQSLQDDIMALEKANKSGSQDQITLSQDALQKAIDQFKNDLASLTQGVQGRHRHHHHHQMGNWNSGTSNSSNSSANSGTTSLLADVAATNEYFAQSQTNIFNINLKA